MMVVAMTTERRMDQILQTFATVDGRLFVGPPDVLGGGQEHIVVSSVGILADLEALAAQVLVCRWKNSSAAVVRCGSVPFLWP